VTSEQLYDEALHTWRSAGGSALHDNIAHLSHLVPGTDEDWQAPDAGDENRGCARCHASIITVGRLNSCAAERRHWPAAAHQLAVLRTSGAQSPKITSA